jgi:anaerobic selenocysteine-containing dehydrogenase
MALASDYLDTSMSELRHSSFTRSNRPKIAYADRRFDHADGKYRFPSELHAEPQPQGKYPLRLLSLVRRDAIHSQMLTEEQSPTPQVWVAPDCIGLKQLDRKQPIFLVSPLGRLEVHLNVMVGLHPAAVICRRGDWLCLGGGINQLIAAGVSDIGTGAPFYEQHVRLENKPDAGSNPA